MLATGLQPTRKALPQLIPDGLPPHVHLQAALATQHPLAYRPRATDPEQYALKYAPDDAGMTCERRQAVARTLRGLAAACEPENEELLSMVEPSVAAVLKAIGNKNVALMREIWYACGARDISSPAVLLVGLPMPVLGTRG